MNSVESGYGFVPIYPRNVEPPRDPFCRKCGEELLLHEIDFAREDDEQLCVPCLREKSKGMCLLAIEALKVGDIYKSDRCFEDAWGYVARIEAAEKREQVWKANKFGAQPGNGSVATAETGDGRGEGRCM